jgi:phytoene desaturase
MPSKTNKNCVVIGSGISGLAAAIRMKNKGYSVTLLEANSFAGGKLSQERKDGFRFDMGPSVFTMPKYVDELFELSGKNPRDYYSYKQLDPVYRYFFEDGSKLDAYHGKKNYSSKMAEKTEDSAQTIFNYLTSVEKIYELTADVFLFNSLHKFKNYFKKTVWRGIAQFSKIKAFSTMHQTNEKSFKDKRLVQIFDRYATYNGSSPYLAPATLNVIPHVEIMEGAYYPIGGMYSITNALVNLAKDIGVNIEFSIPVEEIILEKNKAIGVKTATGFRPFDVVISNMDIYNCYKKLMPTAKKPIKNLLQPKSSSGIIFYWGIKKQFAQLNLHNIFFSDNYEEEFDYIFNKKEIYHDPTIYLNITSKETPNDAPEGCENWFTLINVPNNSGQNWDDCIQELRKHVIAKLNRMLNTDIAPLIITEIVFDPRTIEQRTGSAFGAIYGNSSNNKFSAFLRHPNFSPRIANLYFCGGSVHPGPSIPLCLLSAKITTNLVKLH